MTLSTVTKERPILFTGENLRKILAGLRDIAAFTEQATKEQRDHRTN